MRIKEQRKASLIWISDKSDSKKYFIFSVCDNQIKEEEQGKKKVSLKFRSFIKHCNILQQ